MCKSQRNWNLKNVLNYNSSFLQEGAGLDALGLAGALGSQNTNFCFVALLLEDASSLPCLKQGQRKSVRRPSRCYPVSCGRPRGRRPTAGMHMLSGWAGVVLCWSHWYGCRGPYWRSSWTETPCCWWMRRERLLCKASTASPKGNHVCPKASKHDVSDTEIHVSE